MPGIFEKIQQTLEYFKEQWPKWRSYYGAGLLLFLISDVVDLGRWAGTLFSEKLDAEILGRAAGLLGFQLPVALVGLVFLACSISVVLNLTYVWYRAFLNDVRDAGFCFIFLCAGFALGFALHGYFGVALLSLFVFPGALLILFLSVTLFEDAQNTSDDVEGTVLRNSVAGLFFVLALGCFWFSLSDQQANAAEHSTAAQQQ